MKTKSLKWSRADFEKAIRESDTIAGVLRKLSLRPRGGNYFTVKKFIREWNIDTTHMLGKSHLKGKKRKNLPSIPLKEVLVENSNYSRKNLKKRLIQENVFQNNCSICKQGQEWNGKNLMMILDHINGSNNDNRIENLRFLCPNCNSQQDTFCGRKNKKNHFCPDCGSKIFKGSVRCVKCSKIYQRKVDRPSYEQLKEDVEQMPYTKIGEKYGVSDNAIRKWIKSYENTPDN